MRDQYLGVVRTCLMTLITEVFHFVMCDNRLYCLKNVIKASHGNQEIHLCSLHFLSHLKRKVVKRSKSFFLKMCFAKKQRQNINEN